MNDYKATIHTILDDLGVAYHNDYPDNKARKLATASLLQLLTEARIEELEALRPLMTDRNVAYTIVDSLEDARGEVCWVENIEELLEKRVADLSGEDK